MRSQWFRRRWLDFRNGHSLYLAFALAFANFILIFHRLLIERIEILHQIFSELWVFAVVFVIIYIPVSIIIGYWHRKYQYRVEFELSTMQNPVMAKWFRILIDLQTGKASKEEVEKIRSVLKSIEDGKEPSTKGEREA